MRRHRLLPFSMTLVSLAGAAGLFACTGDDTSTPVEPSKDAGTVDATFDGSSPLDSAPPPEAAPDAGDAGDAGVGPYLLLTYAFDNYAKSEYAAIDLGSGLHRGGFQYPKYGTNVNTTKGPWVLNQHGDVVMKMDPALPWITLGSWSVAEPKSDAGGNDVSDPFAVAETDTKAYVALFDRNVVPVLDTTSLVADGGAPVKTIDLSSLVQPGDTDGYVEATAAVYDAKRGRVWLVLGNIDINAVDPNGFFAICTPGLSAKVVAIDVTTDALVPGVSYTLKGISPAAVTYDVANDRLLILDVGCNEAADSGAPGSSDAGDAAAPGPGPMVGRGVESVDLTSGQSTMLLDANAQGFPGAFVYAGPHEAYVGFGGVTYAWDPGVSSLGAVIANAPDAFVSDGKGRLVGPKSTYLADGGIGSIDVVSVDPKDPDAGVTTIGSNPVSSPDPGGYFEGTALWPSP